MLVRFEKHPPSASADLAVCLLLDGTSTLLPLPRAAVLPLLAVRLVIESTLPLPEGFFGRLALQTPDPEASPQAHQSALLAPLFQAEQWTGPSSPETFLANLAAAALTAHLPPPSLSAPQLAELRIALRTFGAAWRPLGPGQSLVYPFPA